MKKNNKLVCQITGTKRQSNQHYIGAKAAKNGVSPEEWAGHYVTKTALLDVQAALRQHPIKDVLTQLNIEGSALEKILKYNGKSQKTLDDFKKERAKQSTAEEVAVAQ